MREFAKILLAIFLASCLHSVVYGQSGEEAHLDPAVHDVVRMLEQGVSIDVITKWLASSGVRPGPLSADDVIALSVAGAPDELMAGLLDLSASGAGLAPGSEPGEAAPGLPVVEDGEGAEVEVEFSVGYHPDVLSAVDDDWDLFVYLDGRPLTWSKGGMWVYDGSAQRSAVDLAPGRHVVRTSLERHRLRSRRKGTWSHQAMVCPSPVVIDVAPGHEWLVRISVGSAGVPGTGGGGALSWSVLRGGEPVLEKRNVGGLPGSWPALCDDARSAFDDDELGSRRAVRTLEGCVEWAELWPGVAGVPGRDLVRGQLQEHDFRPIPAATR